jgi:magnesium-transporting ATPase (P-type)
MNEELIWRFDAAVIECLIILVVLVILAIAGAVITRQSLRAFRKSNKPVSISESWHTESVKAVFELLEITANGLSKQEAGNRVTKYGLNRLPEPKTRGPLVRFFYQFHNVLIYVLMAASAVTAMLGHWVDASVILGVELFSMQ